MYNITQEARKYNFTTVANRLNSSNGLKTSGSSKWVNIFDQGLLSLQQFNMFLDYRPLALMLCTVGILASCLNIAVNSSLRKDAYVLYLRGINIADHVWFLSDWIGLVLYLIFPFSSRTFQIYNQYLTVYGGTVVQRSAVILNCLASSERFLKLTFPFFISTNVLNRFPRVVIACVFLLCLLLNAPLLAEFEIRELKKDFWMLSTTKLAVDNPGLFLALRNVSRVVLIYLPLIYLLVINLALVAALRLHARKQQDIRATRGTAKSDNQKVSQLHGSSEKSAQAQAVMATSRLVFVLTLIFFLMTLPSTLNATVDSFVDDYGVYSRNFYLSLVVTYLAAWISYFIEPCFLIVSMVLSRQFRTAVLRLLHVRRRRETSMKSDGTRTTSFSRTA